ncbi:autotransporter-associated beta strand repeat-containing protein [Roseococcus suduntuyensis]|uniref:Autotransporter-associated beta strand protein n=1 Tax=Roseococcus suduntuyensis TaxID=455361 RepID=A0A840ACF0_9PROT|nr:autotransporter-associated beta strand repeat-containing protein [Roseococcus suduntuyensis]MBB3898767.1 autotransporter-associated beta strand protein [Roseococcus suduntuyensis]
MRSSTALTGVSRPSRPVSLLASAAFAVLCGLAVPAAAQPVWIGPGTDFNTGSNWSTGIVPDGGGAIFQNTGPTSVFTSVNTTFGGITFAAGAPTYTLTLGDFAQFSADVVNNSGVEQIIVVPTGQTLFMQGSSATGTNVTYQLVGQMSLDNISPGGESRYVITNRLVFRGAARSTTLGALSGTGNLQSLTDNDITARIGGLNTNDTFSGQILQGQAGAILLEKVGTGTLTLAGLNLHTGGTTITAGTLQVGNGGTTGTLGNGAVVNNAALVFNRSDVHLVGNLISGGGTLAQEGTGTLVLTGANTYSGTTTITAGTLQIGDGGTIGTLGSGAVVNNAALVFNRSDAVTVGNLISGGGTLTQEGTGVLTLTGANTYSGGTIINAGTIALDDLGGLGTGLVTLDGGALRSNVTGTLGNNIRLADLGTGTIGAATGQALTLTGQLLLGQQSELVFGSLTDTGTITAQFSSITLDTLAPPSLRIAGGTLISGNGNIPQLIQLATTTTIDAGATLDLNGNAPTSSFAINDLRGAGRLTNTDVTFIRAGDFAGEIAGTMRLEKISAGTLILTGTNSYSGGTTIDAGTLQVGNGGTTGTLGSGAVVNNAALVFNRSDAVTFGNAISGSGTLTQEGSGTLILTGANTYSGTTTITTGTLQVGDGGTTGTLGSGAVVNNAALVFNRSDAVTVGNLISGSGTLTQEGSGTLILTGANTYSGTTTITAGTLQIGAGGTTGTLGSGAVVNNAALVFNRSDAVTVGNLISGGGTLTQEGTGVLTLTGANTYSGTTTITAGTLQIGDGGTTGTLGSGAVVNNAALVFNRSDAVTVGNLISGSGTLTQSGTGVLTLTGANTYSGGTIINAGTLALGDLGALGAGLVTINGGTLRSDVTGTLANNIGTGTSGTQTIAAASGQDLTLGGDLIVNGPVTLAFGSATETGTVTLGLSGASGLDTAALLVAGGTLRTGNLTGAVFLSTFGTTTINAGATLDYDTTLGTELVITNLLGSGTLTNNGLTVILRGDFAGEIAGTMRLEKVSSGTLILTGANTYSGGTTITAGTLQVGAGGTAGTLGSGAVVNNAALVFNRSDAVTVDNLISGSGTVTQAGSGHLILTTAQTYTGATLVRSGRLSVNGSIAASAGVTVEAGGTLGGTGTLPGVAVLAGGAIAPGNSIGTLTVSGNLTLAPGSITQIEVDGPLADRINVSGTATLGGTLQLVALGGSYNFNAPYTLIQASAVAGSFATVDTQGSFGAGVTSTVTTTATEAQLVLTPAMLEPIITDPPPPPPTPGVPVPILGQGTPNQIAVARGFDRAVTRGADVSAFFPLYNLPAAQLPRGLDQVSGQVHAVAAGLHAQGAGQFLGAVLDPARNAEALGDGAAGSTPRYAVWATALAGNQRMGAGGNAPNFVSSTSGGVAAGADVRLSAQVVAGLALAATGATARLSEGLGRAEGTQLQGAVYGTGQFGPLRLAAALAYGATELSTERQVPFFGAGQLRGDVTSQGVSTRLEAGWRVADVLPGVALTPQLAFQGSWYTVPSYSERATGGQGPAALAVAGQTHGQSRLEVAVRADMSLGTALSGFARAGWAAYLQRDARMSAQFIGLPQAGFTVSGPRPDAHAALVSGGLDWRLSPSTTVTARVDAELSGRSHAVNGTARIRYAF